MEARLITIVSSKEQKKYVINTGAETLGELKACLQEAGIDYTDMDFLEGLTKTLMINDDSALPKDVQRINRTTGESTTTNELLFLLTNTNKKITSGSYRSDIYDIIKSHNMQEGIKEAFGKNYTLVPTVDLEKYVEQQCAKEEENKKQPAEASKSLKMRAVIDRLIQIIYSLVDLMEEEEKAEGCEDECQSPYTNEEINNIFNSI